MGRVITLDGIGTAESGSVSGSYTTTGARTGSCYRASTLLTGTSQRVRVQYASAASKGPFYFRIYLKADALPSVEMRFAYLSNTATQDTGVGIYLTVDSGGLIRLYDEDGQIGSASSAISTGTYYRIEFEYNTNPSAGNHVVRARIDGIEFAGAANRSLSIDLLHFYYGGNLHLEANTAGDFKFDDIAVNDATGSFEYNYPGDGAYFLIAPDAAGDNNDWTNSYAAVDELPPSDADFQSSNTLNQIIDHNLAATTAGIGSGDTIKVVAVNSRFAGAGASANASAVLRIKASSGGTVEESSSAITATNTTYRTNDPNNAVLTPRLTLYNLPGPSGDFWTKALLDTAQIGARLSATNTNGLNISALWLGVESSTVSRSNYDSTQMMQALEL